MNSWNKLIFFISVLSLPSLSESSPVFVSLGKDCESAGRLRQFYLRNTAFPFDWMSTPHFNDVCRVIENRFLDFLKPEFLKHYGIGILNTLYNVGFRHDFPTTSMAELPTENTNEVDIADNFLYQGTVVDNFLDYLDVISQKYTRRINRFMTLLNEANEIIFVRTHAKPTEAENFVKMMKNNYPLTAYLLVIVHGNANLDFHWNIPQVKSFYMQEKHPKPIAKANGWFHPDEWKNIFIQLGFIQPTQKKELEDICISTT